MELLTKAQVGELLALHPESVMRLSREGKLPRAIKIGGRPGSAVRFDKAEIEACVASQRAA